MPARHLEKVQAHARRVLAPAHDSGTEPRELIRLYRSFLKKEEHRIRLQHRAGLSGTEVCRQRSGLLDTVMQHLFASALKEGRAEARVALIATGGYGRGLLNPGSDVDVHFLHPERGAQDIPPRARQLIESVITMMWDVGFKVGHAVRSLKETFQFARKDHQTMCALIECRHLAGDRALSDDFESKFRRVCIAGREKQFLQTRIDDLHARHARNENTVYLQEPNVKSGCGGLRDYHNMIWVSWVKLGVRDLTELVKRRLMSRSAVQEALRAHDFLLRVRNDLHYSERRAADVLTLRVQGLVATNFGYAGRRIVQRTEALMRDYYHHARLLYQHNLSLMERFELDRSEPKPGIFSFLALRSQEKRESFDGFHSRDGFLFAENDHIFREDSGRLIRLFQHAQVRRLKLSPQLRTLFKDERGLINRSFRSRQSNFETWEAILGRKGEMGAALRQMHHLGFLGRYLPEFMPLTDLVQHEFFHRYSADEHTLQCLDRLDELSDTRDPRLAFHQQMFHELEDPFVLSMALLLHDTGRAGGVKRHAYASTELADKVCRRLQITGQRRHKLLFLVDNHLLMWQTATTRNLDDPEVIGGFAKLVRSKEWLDALYLHTCADSRATNLAGWTEWKEGLVRHLYHNTVAWFAGQEEFQSRVQRAPADLRAALMEALDPGYATEVGAHLTGMPARYFNFREAADIALHVRTCRQFFRQLRREDDASALRPVIRWVARPEQGSSEIILVTWDRHLLLAKVAGSLAACGVNILSADLFVRADGIVIDLFRVCTTALAPVTDERVTGKVNDLICSACMGGEINFDEIISRRREKEPSPPPGWEEEFPQRVRISNDAHQSYTVVDVQAIDRIGLLYSLFNAIGRRGLEITHARINTEKGAAIDSLCITDADGFKVRDPALLRALEQDLQRALGIAS